MHFSNFSTNNFRDTTMTDSDEFKEKMVIDWGNKTELKFLKLDINPGKIFIKVIRR